MNRGGGWLPTGSGLYVSCCPSTARVSCSLSLAGSSGEGPRLRDWRLVLCPSLSPHPDPWFPHHLRNVS